MEGWRKGIVVGLVLDFCNLVVLILVAALYGVRIAAILCPKSGNGSRATIAAELAQAQQNQGDDQLLDSFKSWMEENKRNWHIAQAFWVVSTLLGISFLMTFVLLCNIYTKSKKHEEKHEEK